MDTGPTVGMQAQTAGFAYGGFRVHALVEWCVALCTTFGTCLCISGLVFGYACSSGARASCCLLSLRFAGHFVSGFVKKQLPMLLVSQMGAGNGGSGTGSSSVSVREALRATFLEVDENLAASTIDCEFSGCTCAVAHLQVRSRWGAWCVQQQLVSQQRQLRLICTVLCDKAKHTRVRLGGSRLLFGHQVVGAGTVPKEKPGAH